MAKVIRIVLIICLVSFLFLLTVGEVSLTDFVVYLILFGVVDLFFNSEVFNNRKAYEDWTRREKWEVLAIGVGLLLVFLLWAPKLF